MSLDTFRAALGSKLGEVLTPELAAWLEENAFQRNAVSVLRTKIERLEHEICKLPQVDCPVRHFFASGLYGREITIRKGVTLTGAVHKVDNIVVVSKGVLELATPTGTVIVKAGDTMVCHAGSKNAATALEDTVWTNVFATDETDVEKLASLLTESTHEELLGGSKNPQLRIQAELNKLEV
jgi:hypothetical protein